MNLNLYLMELKQYRLSFLIWCLSICSLIILGMAFYPMIAQQDFLSIIDVVFEYPVMKNLMAAFNIDLAAMTNVATFYAAYTSLYVILTGCIFSISMGARIISREEYFKTADFLFSRPISRRDIFFSKLAAYISLLIILNTAILVSGITGMELFKNKDYLTINVEEKTKTRLAKAFREQPERFRLTFDLKPDDYVRYTLNNMLTELQQDPEKLKEHNLELRDMESLMEKAADSPEKLLEQVKTSPEEFLKQMNLTGIEQEEFLLEIEKSEAALSAFKSEVAADPVKYVELFEQDPVRFLDRYKQTPEEFKQFLKHFGLEPQEVKNLFIYYNLKNFLILCLYVFLLMLCLGSLGLFISMIIRNAAAVSGAAIGITLGFYFMNSISNVSPRTNAIGYISPFKFVNTQIQDPAYSLDWWRVVYFLGISLFLITVSGLIFRRKDILV